MRGRRQVDATHLQIPRGGGNLVLRQPASRLLMDRVEVFEVDSWSGPFDAGLRQHAISALESGKVLFLPRLAFPISEDEGRCLAGVGTGDAARKNVSYDPATGRCKADAPGAGDMDGLAAILARFGERAEALLTALAPGYAPGLERARASFRPHEVAERDLSWRKDDRRQHIDASPSRPVRGRRILRVFSNIDPAGAPRRWRLGEPFEQHAARFLPRLRGAPPGQAWLFAKLGVTRGPQSRYDQLMLALHDAAKRDAAYQAEPPAAVFDFPAGSSWIVYTDQAPHGALAGRFALEQTFHLEPAAMAEPERAPLAVLQRLTGRVLV